MTPPPPWRRRPTSSGWALPLLPRQLLPLLVIVVTMVLLQQPATAMPSGAGECKVGEAAVGDPHKIEGAETGTLEDAGMTLSFNNIPVEDGLEFMANNNFPLVLTATNFADYPIRGFSIVLSYDTTTNPSDAALLNVLQEWDSNDPVIQSNVNCEGDNMNNPVGLTHRDAEPKDGVNLLLTFYDGIMDLKLDVTVVVQNSDGISKYYYSGFNLQILSEEDWFAQTVEPTTEGTDPSATDGLNVTTEEEQPEGTQEPTTEGTDPSETDGLNVTDPATDGLNTTTTTSEGDGLGNETAAGGGTTVMDILGQQNDFEMFLSALTLADLAETLGQEGPFTVYAITNEAFYEPFTLQRFFSDIDYHRGHLRDFLGRHIIPTVSDDETQTETANGYPTFYGSLSEIDPTWLDPNLLQLTADNGVVHGITNYTSEASQPQYILYDLNEILLLSEMSDKLSNFFELLTLNDMTGLITDGSDYTTLTVFAPTNEALEADPVTSALLQDLPDSAGELKSVLERHITAGNILPEDFERMGTMTMWNSDVIPTPDASTFVMGPMSENVRLARNGILYALDTVFQDPATDNADDDGGMTDNNETAVINNDNTTLTDDEVVGGEGADTIVDILEANPIEFSLVLAALEAAELTEVLRSSEEPAPYTLFAPTDEALASVNLERLLSEDYKPHLEDFLFYHVKPGITMSTDLTEGSGFASFNGEIVNVTSVDPITLNLATIITAPDQVAGNGVVHTISQPLFPRSYLLDAATMAVAEGNERWSLLRDLIYGSGELMGEGPYTIFAVLNSAYEITFFDSGGYPAGDEIMDIVMYQATNGILLSQDLEDGMELIMLNGEPAIVTLGTMGEDPKIGNANIIESDILVNNGIIHVIDAVLGIEDEANATISDEGNSTACELCSAGMLDPFMTMPDGTPCDLWYETMLNVTAAEAPSSDRCLVNRLYAAAYCGCPVELEAVSFCDPCSGEVVPLSDVASLPTEFLLERELPDITGDVFCSSLLELPAVDLTETCNLLYNKYASFCGCPRAIPSCSLCEGDPEDKPVPGTGGASCLDVGNVYSVQTPETCQAEDVLDYTELDIAAYCCPEIEPSYNCGESPCSATISDEVLDLVIPDSDITCQVFVDVYPSATDCELWRDAVELCCAESDTNSTTSPGGGNSTCQLCDGFSGDLILPDGGNCGEVFLGESGEPVAESEDDCTFRRAASAGHCGCELMQQTCNICDGTVVDGPDSLDIAGLPLDRLIPGDVSFTCRGVFALPALDGETTCSVLNALYSGWCGCEDGVDRGTLEEALSETDDLSEFWLAVEQLNIDEIFANDEVNFTVFAPSNEAMQEDEGLQFYDDNAASWTGHLTNILENHIVEGMLFTDDFWDRTTESLDSLAGGSLSVDAINYLVGNQSIIGSHAVARNGLLYETDGVLHPSWHFLAIPDILSQTSAAGGRERWLQEEPVYSFLLGLLNEQQVLIRDVNENGTTLVAPRDEAFEGVDIGDSQENVLLYHVMDINNYLDARKAGSHVVLSTRAAFDVLVSVDDENVLRYNDVVVNSEVYASNG